MVEGLGIDNDLDVSWAAICLFYVILVPVVCFGYIASLCMIFCFKDTSREMDLTAEYNRMAL